MSTISVANGTSKLKCVNFERVEVDIFDTTYFWRIGDLQIVRKMQKGSISISDLTLSCARGVAPPSSLAQSTPSPPGDWWRRSKLYRGFP